MNTLIELLVFVVVAFGTLCACTFISSFLMGKAVNGVVAKIPVIAADFRQAAKKNRSLI